MIDSRWRGYFQPAFEALAKPFIFLKIQPNTITIGAFIIGVLSGVCIAYGQAVWGLVLLWLSGLLDVLDGSVGEGFFFMKAHKRLLLVGGGHAHIFLIKQFYLKGITDLEVVLVSTSQYQYYSGMASGFVEGIYTQEELSFDFKTMCQKSGVLFIEAKVIQINAINRTIKLEKHEVISFDILSFDTGSEMAGKSMEGVLEYAWCVKPLENLSNLRTNFIEQMQDGDQVFIAGGGAAGVEMSLALRALSHKIKKSVKIALVDRNPLILKGYSKDVRASALRKLNKDKIMVLTNHKISRVYQNSFITESGEQRHHDFLVWAAGPTANQMYKDSGLSVDQDGYMKVNGYLQSIDHPFIFGAGDCISFVNFQYVNKVGVYAVKAAPYLMDNILKYNSGKEMTAYLPQKDYLAILSTGNNTGILQYKGRVISGHLVWKLKDFIDRSFMRKYKTISVLENT